VRRYSLLLLRPAERYSWNLPTGDMPARLAVAGHDALQLNTKFSSDSLTIEQTTLLEHALNLARTGRVLITDACLLRPVGHPISFDRAY
jgi:hypothetical protein